MIYFERQNDGGKCLTSKQTIYVEPLEAPHKMKSSLVQYQETESKCISTRRQNLKPVDLVFHIRRGSKCQHLIQRSYYGDKWSEMKVKTVTYLEVN